ncbi:MAG: hypothetical protein AMS15_08510 [Planctomycetes bacterium DG_23]|nr:MAG: hypothetical protein AMS15_08510 [Planctomycetes bacterium DG_23]
MRISGFAALGVFLLLLGWASLSAEDQPASSEAGVTSDAALSSEPAVTSEPASEEPTGEKAPGPSEPAAEEQVRVLTLAEAIRIAHQNNLDYLREIEDVYLAGLDLRLTQHEYGPLFSGSLDVGYQGGPGADEEASQDLSLKMTQKLPLGGDLTVSGSSSGEQTFSSITESYSSSLSVSLRQPLGQDAGRLVYREDLTEAERALLYTVRNQELYHQSFSIDVASDYFRILQRKKAIESNRRALALAEWTFEQAEALRKLGDTSAIDVSRARNSVLSSRDRLNQAIQNYELSLDRFKQNLRLPLEERIELSEEELTYQPLEVDLKEAVQIALARRLDLLNARDQLDDARRNLTLAKQELKPSLDFVASFTLPTDTGDRFGRQAWDDPYFSAGLELAIPFDKWSERTSYRRSYISYLRERRSLARKIDDIIIEVRSALRDLQKSETSIEIQRLNKEDTEKRKESAEYDLLLEVGRRSTRDVLEAQEDLFDAEIAYDEAVVDYLVAKMNLKKAMGIIIIDEKGEWAK